jgi:hypothetical protein
VTTLNTCIDEDWKVSKKHFQTLFLKTMLLHQGVSSAMSFFYLKCCLQGVDNHKPNSWSSSFSLNLVVALGGR